MRESEPLVPRFDPPHVLVDDLKEGKAEIVDKTEEGFTVKDGSTGKVVVTDKPFR